MQRLLLFIAGFFKAVSFSIGCALVAILLNLSGCATDYSKKNDPRELARKDMEQLRTIGAMGASSLSTEYQNAYRELFGGITNTDVETYVRKRVMHFLSPSAIVKRKYITGYEALLPDFISLPGYLNSSDSKLLVLAANIGAQLFIDSIINNVKITVQDESKEFPVKDVRSGLILLGDGYAESIKQGGKTIRLPSWYRQHVLIHEATHSNCPNGISKKIIEELRGERSVENGSYTIGIRTDCTFAHSDCSETHPSVDLRGLPVCDDRPWGAYTFSWLVSEAALKKASEHGSESDWVLAATVKMDNKSRLNFDTDALLQGRLGRANTGILGVVE